MSGPCKLPHSKATGKQGCVWIVVDVKTKTVMGRVLTPKQFYL